MDVLPLRRTNRPPATTPLRGLDAVRAAAALAVVLLHACVPYLTNPMPGLCWPVRDTTNTPADLLFWSIEVFIMPLFLAVAGFLTWRSLSHGAPSEVISKRFRRIVVPFVFGFLVVLPLDLHVWVLGWVCDGLVAPVKLRSFKFDSAIDADLWGTSHLWFLQYLFLYVVGMAAITAAASRWPRIASWRPRRSVIAAVLFGVAAVCVFMRPGVVWGFQHSFWPVPSKFVYCGTYFVAGAWLAMLDPELSRLSAVSHRLFAPAVLLLAAALALGRWHVGGGEGQVAHATMSVLSVAAAVSTVFCILGVATKHLRDVPPIVKYIAAASFWIYLVHHPVVGLVHIDLKWLLPQANPILKLVIAWAVTVGFSLLTYEGLVRRTRLGRMLGLADQKAASIHDPEIVSFAEARSESDSGPSTRRAA